MSELFEFLYLSYFSVEEKQQLLEIIYQYFNEYPDYSDKNHFIFSLLFNLKFIYQDSHEKLNLFIDFMACLYPKATPVKQGIIEVVLLPEELQKMHDKFS